MAHDELKVGDRVRYTQKWLEVRKDWTAHEHKILTKGRTGVGRITGFDGTFFTVQFATRTSSAVSTDLVRA